MSSQKTTIANDKVMVRPVNPKADKYIDKMIKLAQAARKRVEEKKRLASEGGPKPEEGAEETAAEVVETKEPENKEAENN